MLRRSFIFFIFFSYFIATTIVWISSLLNSSYIGSSGAPRSKSIWSHSFNKWFSQPQEQFAKPTCFAQRRIRLDRTLNFSQDCHVQNVKRILQSTSRMRSQYHCVLATELSKSAQKRSRTPFFNSRPKQWSTSASQSVQLGVLWVSFPTKRCRKSWFRLLEWLDFLLHYHG